MARTITPKPAALRRCAGAPKYGIEAHDAPLAAFPKLASASDGLGRRCTSCMARWRVAYYHGGDAAAPRVVPPPSTTGRPRKATADVPARKSELAMAAGDRARDDEHDDGAADAAVVDGTEAQRAEHAALEAAVDAAGGIGTDDGQALMAQAADEAAAARRAAWADEKRRQRAAKRAATLQA